MNMVIVSQSRKAIWNFDDVSRLHVTGSGKSIAVMTKTGNGGEMGKYKSDEQCQFVLGMLVAAISAGDISFRFPEQSELEYVHQHGSSGGGCGHGGS